MPKKALPSTTQPKPPALPTSDVETPDVLPEAAIAEPEVLPTAVVQQPEELPKKMGEENDITIGGETIRIKATRLYYQRNGTAGFYRVLQQMPLIYIFNCPDDFFDPKRTPTKCLMDWVTAVTDNPDFTKKHFDDMTSEDIYHLLDLFLRLNKLEEMEEAALKNRQATATRD